MEKPYDFQVVLDRESTEDKFGMTYKLTFENLVVVGVRTWNNYNRRVKEHLTAALRQLTRRHWCLLKTAQLSVRGCDENGESDSTDMSYERCYNCFNQVERIYGVRDWTSDG